MSMSKIALAFPLALGIACSTSGAQSRENVPAMSAQADQGGTASALTVQPTAGNDQAGTSGSMGTGSSDSAGSSGSMGSPQGSSDTGGSQGSGGSQMGSGGTSETMGSEKGTEQGATGTSDQAQQGATAGSGDTGAHMGDQHVMGKITKISKDEISIAPKGAKAKTLKINDSTTVSVNGKDAKWSQLKKGQSVRASYENVSGDDVAVRIESGAMRHGRMKHHGTSGGMHEGSGMHGGSEGGGTESGGSSGSSGAPDTGK